VVAKSAREIALNILVDVNEKGAYSNIAIYKHLQNSMDKRDENLVREIVYGVLENRLYIDYIISKVSKIKLKKLSALILEILRIGVYQIVFMDRIPDSAAVNESVNLSRKYSHKGTLGYVNGVLRNISRNKEELIKINKNNVSEYLSTKYSHPKWIVDRWLKEYGEKFTEELCIANNQKPKLNVRVNILKTSREDLKERLTNKGYDVIETKYSHYGLIIENPYRITELDEFRKGYFTIQDESSMLVSQIMNPEKDSLVVDACSGPGGKATHMAEIMDNKGKIISRDVYEHKIKLIEDNCERLGIDIIETQIQDASAIDEYLVNRADYLLIDAPCTGFGLIRRRPEIKWNREEKDINNLLSVQKDILNTCSKYLKVGGILIYSTCTIISEENIKMIRNFLKDNKDFKLIGFKELIKEDQNLSGTENGYIQLFPNISSTDGFFIAKMKKIN